ncbi:MAG TPA: hypothetical protein VFN38_18825, partial [Gemmatimonadaceae bacterium]|nr:hypothetical protein [Gemmatimonadaceae bacterium]
MRDDLHSDGLDDGRRRERPEQPGRPLADREVPLGPPRSTIADAVHAWLDGDATESQARRGGAGREVDFWKRLDEDLAVRRRLRTPAYLPTQIMNALPMHAPTLITPWWRREFVVTPSNAIVVATTLVVMAAAATALVFR